MTKFKVGDKVRILKTGAISALVAKEGAILEVVRIDTTDGTPFLLDVDGAQCCTLTNELQFIELVSDKPTKNQRITTLESEVAELKAKVEALEKAQKRDTPLKSTVEKYSEALRKMAQSQTRLSDVADVYYRGEYIGKFPVQQITPNEQRKAIIAEAKAFIETKTHYLQDSPLVKGGMSVKRRENPKFSDWITKAEFIVNAEKRTVVTLIRNTHDNKIRAKAIAKCAPDDVFNADIGKAIALGRALGLDVSRFEQAVKPTEVVVGMKVTACFDGKTEEYTARNVYKEGGEVRVNPKEVMFGYYPYEPRVGDRIIDDTEAVY